MTAPRQRGRRRLGPLLAALCLVLGTAAHGEGAEWAVTVDGAPVALPRPVTLIGGELFVPLLPIARALGFQVEAAREVSGLRVRRGGGVDGVYDGRTGEIRFGPVVVAQLGNFKQITVVTPLEQVLFPLNGVIALLAVDVQQNPDRESLNFTMSGGALNVPSPPGVSLNGADYSFGVTRAGGEIGHYTQVQGDGFIGRTAVNSRVLASGTQAALDLRQGVVTADFGRNRTLIVGDQFTRGSADALSSSVRGVGYQSVFGQVEANAYAGWAAGRTYAAPGGPSVAQYDTTIVGGGLRRRTTDGDLSFSASRFEGPERAGQSVGATFARNTQWNQMKVQAVVGAFSGLSLRPAAVVPTLSSAFVSEVQPLAPPSDRTPVQGGALGVSIVNTFSPLPQVALTVQADRYGKNFLTATEDTQFSAQSRAQASISLRPFGNLGLFGSVNRRTYLLGDPSVSRGFSYGANAPVPRVRQVQVSYFRSVQNDTGSAVGPFQLSQFAASVLDVRRFSGTVQLSSMEFDKRETRTITASLNKALGSGSQVGLHAQRQPGSLHRYGADWELTLPGSAGSVRVGVDRLRNVQNGDRNYVPTIRMALLLPGSQRMQLAYTGERGAHMVNLVVGGPVVRRSDVRRDADGTLSVTPKASIEGRVYLDADNDNSFNSGRDQPWSEMTVWLDERVSVRTDEHGRFRFDQVAPGAHVLRGDLAEVPADMVFGQASERRIAVLPFRGNVQDFAMVRTGTLMGKVTYFTSTDEGGVIERPLVDARVFADPEHDTYSDTDGNFTIGGLPPGTYRLQVDPDTAPEGFVISAERSNRTVGLLTSVSAMSPLEVRPFEVQIAPAETLRGVRITLVRPVVTRELPKTIAAQDEPALGTAARLAHEPCDGCR